MKKLNGDKAFSGFSVNDIQKAKQFYGETLGLEVTDAMMGLLELHLKSDSKIIIYPKPNHTPASFTILNFAVDNIEETVRWMKEKGVAFESYDEPMKTDEDNIFRAGGPVIAWFKDPAGNILAVIEEKS